MKHRYPSADVFTAMEELLKSTSDGTRLKILFVLLEGPKNVSQIQSLIGASQSLVSHQLKILRDLNLVSTQREGTFITYQLSDDHVVQLLEVVYEHALEKRS